MGRAGGEGRWGGLAGEGRRGAGHVAEQVPQGRFEPRVTERVPGGEQGVRADPLACLGQLARTLRAQQQPRPEARDRDDCRAAQHLAEDPGVVEVPDRVRGDRVDRPGQSGIDQRAQVDVGQIVDADPGQPLPPGAQAPAQARLEQREQQLERAAARRLHDAGAYLDDPQARLRGGGGSRLPVHDEAGQEVVTRGAVLAEDLIAPVGAVVADRGGADEGPRAAGGGGGQLGQPPGGADPAVPDGPFVRRREPACDADPGQVHHGVHAGQQFRVGLVRLPLALAARPGRVADQPDHLVAAGGEQRGQRGPDDAAGPGDRDGQRLAAMQRRPALDAQVGGELAVPVGEHLPQR